MKLTLDIVHKQLTRCSSCMHATVADGEPHCTFNNREIEFFSEAYACPKGLWKQETVFIRGVSEPKVAFDEDSRTLWLNKPDPKIEAELDAAYERTPGHLRWPVADKPFLAQVFSFGKSVLSGPATPEVIAIRKKSCFGDESTTPCPVMKKTSTGSYCAGCKCGTWQLAQLDGTTAPKLGWAYLECPLKREGFSNARS